MTVLLFIPATVSSGDTRRVDFASIASLFAECEEPVHRANATRNLLRAAAAALLLLLVIGDALLVTRPGVGTGLPAAPTASASAML